MSGGSVGENIEAFEFSRVTLSGGSVGRDLVAFELSTILIVGSDFAVDGVPVDYGPIAAMDGVLTGTLQSGDPIATSSATTAVRSALAPPRTA